MFEAIPQYIGCWKRYAIIQPGEEVHSMWVRKYERDRAKGVDSPMPTQVLSNEEILPRPQNAKQREWEHRIGEIAARNSARLGMERRGFMRSAMVLLALL